MENEYNSSIEAALHHYKEGMGYFSEQMPDIAHKYHTFTEACFAEGVLSQKEKQLIALGISINAQDEYCIIYHVKGCLDQGASREEILETVAVTGAFGGGAALSQGVTLVEEAIQELSGDMFS
ncbi:carboxymuconolactone decarboxylase family protein [Salipaludibacillus agaradhaerens]|uniref:Carboxymuconolactone decarboxylase family protein n=1 Tax=Salipaludibacillus agaradhaerens TaxID=76935 RepID=A0A9Q4AYX4_SALAG|nr:carboxymuconolactone decarboxylase family protein [Salipaludibacillus agaradhaerens]UJW58951.1 carboxymuconolactone decarboxylase family protein [Bacillus sp. A116_S68]MCR6095214.1 carboxymuconolactone decarboxylase family protein [Salipaludibacillus agaradhaerens]MCR6107874.1 carboxymuconolactone decarboxylase family protein [Salipaludibacillus agaradhaerens]MCR6115228.1 carboxymuconolactone decarboxylase family protein [Salipaludibacillus agaradhaerens]MCR6119901.1 carboxymuconolactone de